MAATLGELGERFGCTVHGSGSILIHRIASLADAGPDALAFLANPHYQAQLESTRAGAVVLEARFRDSCPVACLVSTNPHADFARMAAVLHPVAQLVPGIAAGAVVAPGTTVAKSAQIAPLAVVGEACVIGESVYIGPGCTLGRGVTIGAGSRLVARVSVLDQVTIGERAVVHPGVVIGADGFGFARDDESWVKVPQIGRVMIGDDVEIGANCAIDRGAIDDTVIEDGVKLDNLVHVAHNVRIGEHTAIAGTAAIAGSTKIGRRCMIAGGVGILGQLEICDDVVILARSLVTRSIRSAGVYSGSLPAEEATRWRRNASRFRRLDDFAGRLRVLEQRSSAADNAGEAPEAGGDVQDRN